MSILPPDLFFPFRDYNGNMQAILKLLGKTDIKELALPANIRYGQAIYKRGGVEVIEQTAKYIEGWAGGLNGTSAEGGGQKRRVRLSVTAKGLGWHCAGNPKNHDIFCKHCVALALFIQTQ